MRRRTAGNEMNFTQTTLFKCFYGQTQMTVVNWIERTAQNSDWTLDVCQLQSQSAHVR